MQIEEITLRNIVNKNIVIPDNQRGYDWKALHADDFWNDMFEFEEEEQIEDYFLGTILVRVDSSQMESKYEILDGQQRLTTIFLFFIALRETCKKHNFVNLEMSLRYFLESKQHFFSPSPSIERVFNVMKNHQWDGKAPTKVGYEYRKVKSVYEFFMAGIKDRIEEFQIVNKTLGFEEIKVETEDHLIAFHEKILDIKIALITIYKIEEGFMLFERMNARGAMLQPTDLLKNFLFSKQISNLKESWERITTNPDDIKRFSVVQMIRYFFMTREGHITKSKLYRALKEIVKPNPEKFVNELEIFADYYRNIISIEHGSEHLSKSLLESFDIRLKGNADRFFSVFKSISGLNRYGIQQPISVIFSYLSKYQQLKLDEDEDYKEAVPYFLECLERFHFINNFILSEPSNKVETHYGNFAQKFYNAKNKKEFDYIEKQLFEKLELGSKDEFIEEFTDLNYIKNKAKLKEIFYRIKLIDKKNGKCKPVSIARRYSIDPTLSNDTWNLDHWLAQNVQDKDLLEKLDKYDDIHNIGNILLISSDLNNTKHFGNKTPDAKVQLLEDNKSASELQDLDLLEFVEEYAEDHKNWTSDVINKRAKKLAKDSFNIFWQFNYLHGLEKQKVRWTYLSPEEIEQMSESEVLNIKKIYEKKVARGTATKIEKEVLDLLKARN
jgi:uncharacterized protein with ParB-like and HNH nuclease domain